MVIRGQRSSLQCPARSSCGMARGESRRATEPRPEWDEFDVLTPAGIRVEVKSSATSRRGRSATCRPSSSAASAPRKLDPENRVFGSERSMQMSTFSVSRRRNHTMPTIRWTFRNGPSTSCLGPALSQSVNGASGWRGSRARWRNQSVSTASPLQSIRPPGRTRSGTHASRSLRRHPVTAKTKHHDKAERSRPLSSS